ncbi:hypothetical protein BH10BDE1_BH10BDE1_03350 [soil metagenome]
MNERKTRELNQSFLNSFLKREDGLLFNLNAKELLKFVPNDFAQTIYFDPPFSNNLANDIPHPEDRVGDQLDKFVWFVDEKKSFIDTCRHYLNEFRRITKDNGSIFLHLPWDLAYDVKPIADEIFGGSEFLRNEIIWVFRRWSANSNALQENHHTILWYVKNPSRATFNKLEMPRTQQTLKRFGDGKIVSAVDKTTGKRVPSSTEGKASGAPLNDIWVWDDNKKNWLFELDEIDGRPTPARREVWGISHTAPVKKMKMVGSDGTYPFEKPVALIERLIAMTTSDPSDVVIDLFAGTGVVAEAAKKLNRKFLLNEISHYTTADIIKRIKYKKTVPGFPLYSHAHLRGKPLKEVSGREFEFWVGYSLGGVSDDSYRGADSRHGLDVIIPNGAEYMPGEVKKELVLMDEWYKIKAKSEKLAKELKISEYAVVATNISQNILYEMSKSELLKYRPILLSSGSFKHLLNNPHVEEKLALDQIKETKALIEENMPSEKRTRKQR